MPDFELAPRKIDIHIAETFSGDARVITVIGTVDILTAAHVLGAIVTPASGRTSTNVIVDLTEVHFLASAGMTMLLDAQAALGSDVSFSVVVNKTIGRPMRLVGLDERLRIYDSISQVFADRPHA